MRVMADTNIFISTLLFPASLPARVLLHTHENTQARPGFTHILSYNNEQTKDRKSFLINDFRSSRD